MAETVDRGEDSVDPLTQVDKSAAATETHDLGSPVVRPNGLREKSQADLEGKNQLSAGEKHSTQDEILDDEGNGRDNHEEISNKQNPKEQDGKRAGTTDDEDDPFAGLEDVSSMDIYDLSNYTFGKKNEETKSKAMKQLPKEHMTGALRNNYNEKGMRRSVGAVILVHSHNFPHVLLLQRSDGKGEYALPGGRLRPGESDEEGLQRKLSSKLKPPSHGDSQDDQELDIGEKRTIPLHTLFTKAFPQTDNDPRRVTPHCLTTNDG